MDKSKPKRLHINLISNDTARCNNSECQLKQNCKRWLQLQIDKTTFWVSRFQPVNNICENQIL